MINQYARIEEASKYFGKTHSYFGAMKVSNKDRYDLVSSFDNSLVISTIKYKEWLINLFKEASMIDLELTRNEMFEVLSLLGYKYKQKVYEFSVMLHCSIDENNFLSIQYSQVQKVVRFIQLCNELGYSDVNFEYKGVVND